MKTVSRTGNNDDLDVAGGGDKYDYECDIMDPFLASKTGRIGRTRIKFVLLSLTVFYSTKSGRR